MRLTLALGLQYDSDARQGVLAPVLQRSFRNTGTVLPAVTFIDSPDAGTPRVFESLKNEDLFFLTYDMHGVPEPFRSAPSRLDLFT